MECTFHRPACFGRVAVAAVEQKAKAKQLNPGTTETLRWKALQIFLSGSIVQSFAEGQAEMLASLERQLPETRAWASTIWPDIQSRYRHHWRQAASYSLELLYEIRSQNQRRGKRGNPGKDGAHPLKSLDAIYLDLLDSHVIVEARKHVHFLNVFDPEEVRAMIRPVVRDLIARGNYGYDPSMKSLSDAIDQHTRRVIRKFDELLASNGNRLPPVGKAWPPDEK